MSWSNDTVYSLLAGISKAKCLIMIDSRGENGFVPNALLMWKSHQTAGDTIIK
jgi:hypothetical protein